MRDRLLPLLLLAAASCREASTAGAPVQPISPRDDAGCTQPAAVSWQLRPRDDGGLELLAADQPVFLLRHGGYRAPGKPARPSVRRLPGDPGSLRFEVSFEGLAVRMQGTATPQGHAVRIDYTVDVTEPLHDSPGVGVLLDFDAAAWGTNADALVLDGSQVRATIPELGAVEARFERDAGKPLIERADDRPTRIRAAWLTGEQPVGTTHATLTLSVPGALDLAPSLTERYAGPPQHRWNRDTLVFDDWPVDLRLLNAAHGRAGSHGRVVVDGEELRFEDGTPARFWGTNVAASALFEASDATITRQAQRLSAMGYNLVRLHHHDAAWSSTNVFDTRGGTTQVLDAHALERLDRWIDTLAQEGIYVWLDLHTGRQFLPGDAIPGYSDMLLGPHPRQARGFQYINPRVETLLEGFAEAYLRRKNPYTGRPWAEEPAIVGTLLTNENDLTHHFSGAFERSTGRETHVALFDALAKTIVDELGLPASARRTLRTPGPGKVLLAEMQHRWDARALAHVRGLGVKTPLVTTNYWGFESLLSLPPLAYGDMIDVHSYGEAEALSTDPHRTAHWLHHIATAQVAGKPMTVTEWAVPKPAADRFTAAPWMAALGALQGWDALLAYNYAQSPLGRAPTRATQWDQRVDPAQLGLSPVAALMFRRGDVALAKNTVAIVPSVDAMWNAHASPKRSAALRTVPERSRMVVVLPDHPKLDWDTAGSVPAGATVLRDLSTDALPTRSHEVTSDTGEIRRDWAEGTLRIDSPRAQVASGWIGGETIRLGDLEVALTTAKATVAAVSLDGAPLHRSSRILVTAVGRAEPEEDGHVRSEPISGEFALRTQGPMRLFPLGPRARAHDVPADTPSVPGKRDGAWVRFPLRAAKTHWFIVAP
jgi:hypothetical protein